MTTSTQSADRPSLSIFFPAFNDAGTIASLVVRAVQVASKLTDDFEVIIVNDGSADATGPIADASAIRWRIVRSSSISSNHHSVDSAVLSKPVRSVTSPIVSSFDSAVTGSVRGSAA